jgi:hypothetical protein
MTMTADQDGHAAMDAVISALGRSGDQMAATLASCSDATRRVPGLVWSVTDLAVHLVVTLQELTRALLGEACAYDGATVAGTSAAVDNRLVDAFPVRDLAALAELFDVERTRFAAALAGLDADHPVPAITPHATALALGAIFVVDHHNHGTQLSRAGARPWQLDLEDIRRCVAAVAPATYDRRAAAHMSWRFALHLRGTRPLELSVQYGTLVVGDVTGPVDCHIVADPSAFLLESAGGFVSRSQMLLHLQMLAYGRKIWALRALPKLLPPVEHGGKLLHGAALRREDAAARRDRELRAASAESLAARLRPRVAGVAPATIDLDRVDPTPAEPSPLT